MRKFVSIILVVVMALGMAVSGVRQEATGAKASENTIVTEYGIAASTEVEASEETTEIDEMVPLESETMEVTETETANSIEMEDTEQDSSDDDRQQSNTENNTQDTVYTYTLLRQTRYATLPLNLRDGPGVFGQIVGVLSYNEKVTVVAQCNETGWYKLYYNGQIVYASNKYLSQEKQVTSKKKTTSNSTGSSSDSSTDSSSDSSTDSSSDSSSDNISDNTSDNTSVEQADWVTDLKASQSASQLLIVAGSGNTATVSLHTKDEDGIWHQTLSSSAYIGKNGLGKTKEGDKKTPTGTYAFTVAFGRLQNPGTALPYTQLDSSYYWVDDSNSMYYNQFVSTNRVTKDWSSAEHLVDYKAYDYAIAINYNASCTPGKGSAIFLHCSTGAPTAGCVAVPKDTMKAILQNVQTDCVVIIDSKSAVYDY